jgi:diguanylate cyclase (GGDEF)-like protein/PAS domain S-box-containing protein
VGDRLAEILQAAIGALEDGVAVLDGDARVLLWNQSAAAISGYGSAEMLSRPLPKEAYEIDLHHLEAHRDCSNPSRSEVGTLTERPLLVQIRHKKGHSLPAMLRRTALRDELGKRFGTLLRFHPVEEIDTLPHGMTDGCDDGLLNHLEESQTGLQDRLDEAMQEWELNQVPFGVLWITVDQALTMRKTHGHDASEAMLRIVEQTLLHGLRPTEMLGRWGTNEYLVVSHERSGEMLESRAKHLAQLSRTADFRWWGDRVPLTISVGAAQANENRKLAALLNRAQKAVEASQSEGGNRVTTGTE